MARILFIQTEWFEHLGVLWLCAAARAAGHEADMIIGRDPKKTAAEILYLNPEVAAFTATTGAHRASLAIARELRPWFKGLIVMGGPHATFFPEVVEEPALDAVCRGEGEVALLELLSRLDEGRPWQETPGWWAKIEGEVARNDLPPLVTDLDSLPFPARDLLERAAPSFRKVSMRRVMAGRGCPYACTYCFNKAMRELASGRGPYVRMRSVDNVIAELKFLAAAGARTINFVDDTFGLKRNWTMEFLERYPREVGLPFIVNLRPEQVDRELAEGLSEAGCYCAQVGIETANEKTRAELLGRAISQEEISEAVAGLKAAGIKVLAYNMVGLPGEGFQEAESTLLLNARLGVDFPRVSIFQPYPRTELGDKLFSREGSVGTDGPGEALNLESVGESYFRRSPLSGKEARRIENLHKLSLLYIRFPVLRRFLSALSRLPANPLFELVFLITMGLDYRKATNRGRGETLLLGLKNLSAYFS